FGRHGHNIVKTILRLAAGDGALAFVDDQHTSTTSAEDLAALVAHLAVGRIPGVFHSTNQTATTWYDFACEVLRFAGHDPARVQAITTAELARPAPRPAFSVLDNAALRASGIPLLADHREPHERLVKELTKP
ncbi:MAG: dTDP-4-dehydrorhamnose reductase, partial [Actinomycetota bacterium]|nr:dTDP-4-dehydrorhamnose reductase [Actinomycetota bacterium]